MPVDFEEAGKDTRKWIAGLNEACREAAAEEPWHESLPETTSSNNSEYVNEFDAMERHPLQQQVKRLLMAFFDLAERTGDRSLNIDMLIRNAMELTGGLAQVLTVPASYDMDESEAGHKVVQLKRAYRGAAFVRGVLFMLRSEHTLTQDEFDEFHSEVDSIADQIVEMLKTVRDRWS
jgi:hypothetical protein